MKTSGFFCVWLDVAMIISIDTIELEDVYLLRNKVLRPGLSIESCHYDEDNRKGVFHLGVFQDKAIVGIASFYPERQDKLSDVVLTHHTPAHDSWRLRGMATEPSVRGRGLGIQLLRQGIKECETRGASILWCNARSNAVSFYQKLNFDIKGEEFMIENIGPHYLMYYKY